MLRLNVVVNKTGRFVPVLLATLILQACSEFGHHTPAVNVQGPADAPSGYYLQQITQSADDNRADWQLLAARVLLNEGKYAKAGEIIDQIPTSLNAVQRQELMLLNAQRNLAQQNVRDAKLTLASIDVQSLSDDQRDRYYKLQIIASQGEPSLALVRAYIARTERLSGVERQKNIDATWQTLTALPPDQLNNMAINADENVLQGWLDLLNVWHMSQGDTGMLEAGIKDWQRRYPQNPAAIMLPASLKLHQQYRPGSTGQIALLLPMSGSVKSFASAIEQGFNDAKNGLLSVSNVSPSASLVNNGSDTQAVGTSSSVVSTAAATTEDIAPMQPDANVGVTEQSASSGAASPARVKVYDTSTRPLQQVLAQAQQDGATMIVGPLLKHHVEQLTNLSVPLNVLALNEPERIRNLPNVCYFALSPEDEARDAAQHIWQQGQHAPLLLVPRNALGDRVSQAFADEWQRLGGGTVLRQPFGATSELTSAMNHNEGIRLNGIPVRPRHTLEQNVSAIPTLPPVTADVSADSSAGIDAVYIVATQPQLQLLKPMIAMYTSSRDDIYFYASSRSAQAEGGTDFRLEMEGLQFSEIPLLSGSNPTLQQQAAARFNNNYSLMRLYAMGIDAWQLANHFQEIRQQPAFQLEGNTGRLSTTPNCVINRTLSWRQYHRGQIIPVN